MRPLLRRCNFALAGAVLTLALLAIGCSGSAEELTNDSRYTAIAVRITFMGNVRITDYGDEFDTVDPSSGSSNVFVFFGGEVRRRKSFEVEWSPSLRIKSVEWLEVYGEDQQKEMELVRTCTRVLSPGDDLQRCIEQAYDGMEICLEPGAYQLEHYVRIGADMRIRGLGDSPGAIQVTCPDYSYVHITSNGHAEVYIENLSFVVPKYSKGSIGAAEDSLLRLDSVWVADGSIFDFFAVNQATAQVSNCCALSITARHRGVIAASGTRFYGDLGTEYESRGVRALEEAQVTLSGCTLSHYRYALNMEQESHLTMTDCVVTDIERDFLDCDNFTGSIEGSGNRVMAPIEICPDRLPSGFLDE